MSAPIAITNPPGLPAIRYRCGTFTSFRQTMLDRMNDPDLLASAVTTLAIDLAAGDTQMQVTDAVNFPISEPFRIKIGTEYLTVVSGAGTLGWKVLRNAPVFHSAGDSVILDPPNPFANWHEGIDSDYQTALIELWAYLCNILTFYQERIANEAFLGTATQRDALMRLTALIGYRPSPGAGASGLASFSVAKGNSVTVPAGFRVSSRPSPGKPLVTFETSAQLTATSDNNRLALALKSEQVPYPPQCIVIRGTNLKLKLNDYLLAVEELGQNDEAAFLLRIDDLLPDPAAGYTTVVWHDVGNMYSQASKDVALYSFAVNAAPLGHVTPRWEFFSPVFTNLDRQHPGALFENKAWDIDVVFDPINQIRIPNAWFYLPTPAVGPDEGPDRLYLDAVYPQLQYSPDKTGWAVLLTDSDTFQIMHVLDSHPTGKFLYGMSARSTRLTFAEFIRGYTFPFRNTRVLTGVEPLQTESSLLLPEVVAGSSLFLDGIHTGLQVGQTILVQGTSTDGGGTVAESAIVADQIEIDANDATTYIPLKTALRNSYVRASCSVLANVAVVTQGETVREEVLGSGDASAFQSFTLAQSPVTYLPSTDPEGLSVVASSLRVTVNGVAWSERSSLVNSAADSQDFVTSQDDTGETTVFFGDGFNGARAPSGAGNIRAQYRKGLGTAGNLGVGLVQKLDSVPGLQTVINPMALTGGADAESLTQMRAKAPSSLRTFGRAVSTADYAALALSYPGIAKAGAMRIAADPVTGVPEPHPYIQLTAASADRAPLRGSALAGNLRRFLDNHRDPNVPLRVRDFNPVYLQVQVEIDIDGRFPRDQTIAAVSSALNDFFSFDRLDFGQTVFLSDIYSTIQSVPGVNDSNIVALKRLGPAFPDGASVGPHDIATGPTEIAVIDPSAFSGSSLIVNGTGGFNN